ncbi:radical SAM protein [Paenibacillus sp. F4]|uniref:radical SAM protein n=1 Tax=Paenibacillus sp. F4 TaxID=357385 RepID=UPI000C9EC884|nr:radical SAM protein [Paenibacillus sp. F4]PNQ82326.1 hypothetical protein C1T21_03715 [Paenibacillus sp. F4]
MNMISRSIQLSGGNKCFVRCPGCYNYFSNTDYATNDLLNFLSQFKGETNISKVTMAGGDPLAREDMPFILQSLKDMGFRINLDTVGLPLIKDAIIGRNTLVKKISAEEIIQAVEIIGIPLDGSTDEIISTFRRGLRVDNIIEILEVLSLKQANICINTVVHKQNYNDIIHIYDYLKKFEAIIKWQLFQYMPIGPGGFKNKHRFEIADDQFNKLKKTIDSLHKGPLNIQFKSRLNRKNQYLLIDGEGVIWIPKQNRIGAWLNDDENNDRILLGHISEKNIVNNVLKLISNYEIVETMQ